MSFNKNNILKKADSKDDIFIFKYMYNSKRSSQEVEICQLSGSVEH